MSDSQIRAESADGVLTLTFDRPEKKNAFTLAMYEGLVRHLGTAAQDPEVRVVVLTGAGDAFSSGNDLMDFMNAVPADPIDNPIIQFLMALVDLDKPLVAGVRGAAVGIGTTILLHCDLAYASETARFRLPFVNLGLVPEGGSSLLLPRMAGHVRAAEMLMLGEPFDASIAAEVGLVNRVVADDALDGHVRARARALADQPAGALREAKLLLRGPQRDDLKRVIRSEAELFMRRLRSPEAMEAFSAFFDKRKPDFRKVEIGGKNP